MADAVILSTDDILLPSQCGNHTYPAAVVIDILINGKREELVAYADGEGRDIATGDLSVRYEYETTDHEPGTLWVRKTVLDAI